jgi:hypothetical protein
MSFARSSLTPGKKNYPITQKELQSIIFGLKKFEHFLWGRKLYILNDHKALEYLFTLKQPSSMHLRHLDFLSIFDCEIIHVAGKLNTIADALSRTQVKYLYSIIQFRENGSSKSFYFLTQKRV